MEEKTRRAKNGFDVIVTTAVVGHIPIVQLPDFKHAIESIPNFDLVFIKTSSGRLWIKEGDNEY